MAIRQDVFDQWWESLTDPAPTRYPVAEQGAPLRPAADVFTDCDGLAARWANLTKQTWDEW